MTVDSPTYFACTLGEAQNLDQKVNPGTINELIDDRATLYSEQTFVGCPVRHNKDSEWQIESLTYAQLRNVSIYLAGIYDKKLGREAKCVGLISESSLELLVTLFACIRLGIPVLMIAPQLDIPAVVHLLKDNECQHCFISEKHKTMADEISNHLSSVEILPVVVPGDWTSQKGKSSAMPTIQRKITGSTVAFIHHTSGTTGLPKSVNQTHSSVSSVMPFLPTTPPIEQFSTTPLYHGGIADVFRSTSNACCWLYPSSAPITAAGIVQFVQLCGTNVGYLTCVPYIIKLLTEDEEGLKLLQRMEVVGTGGAGLDQDLGDWMVKQKGINLISRYGSSECQFLLHSFRDFKIDQDWDYLRVPQPSPYLHFEKQSDSDTVELIVLNGWPVMAKKNRNNKDYATSDIFLPHATRPHLIKYMGRNDDLLVMENGKKFSPESVETTFLKQFNDSSIKVPTAIIFGENRPNPGLLVFSDEAIERIWLAVQNVNKSLPNYERVQRDALIILPLSRDADVPRTVKHTILRKKAWQKFSVDIDAVYSRAESSPQHAQELESEKQARDVVGRIVFETLETDKEFEDDADFFEMGMDSLQATRIGRVIQKQIDLKGKSLSTNVVFDHPSIERLAKHIYLFPRGENDKNTISVQAHMMEMAKTYGSWPSNKNQEQPKTERSGGYTVLLTGTTGGLGAHLLSQLTAMSWKVTKVICLVRGATPKSADERVLKSLQNRNLIKGSNVAIEVYQAKLGEPYMGVSQEVYSNLLKEVDYIIHAAWAVNFGMTLRSFEKDHINGLHNLLELALNAEKTCHTFFCSSVASVGALSESSVLENLSEDPNDAGLLGYSQSKWVAEKVCAKFPGDVTILRIGQLCGDTVHGIWNEAEGWPLMIRSFGNDVECLPALNENLSWLPIDQCASAIVDLLKHDMKKTDEKQDVTAVYHLVNPNHSTTWLQVVQWLKEYGAKFDVASPGEWISRLEQSHDDESVNRSKKLLSMWKDRYGGLEKDAAKGLPVYDATKAKRRSNTMNHDVKDLTSEYMSKVFDHWRDIGFLRI